MEKILGIVLTKKSVRICESRILRGKTKIVNLKEGVVKGFFDKNLEREIKRFIRINRIKTKNASYSIPDEDVLIRVNTYPLMPEEDLRKIILDEISSYKIFENDYPILNLFRLKVEENKARYLIIVSPRKKIEFHLKFLKNLNLNVKNIDVPSIASFRANKIFRKELFKGNGVFIFLSERKTTLIFFTDGEILLLRDFEIGIDNIKDNFSIFRNEVSNTISYFSREEKKTIEKLIISGIEEGLEEYIDLIRGSFGVETYLGEVLQGKSYYYGTPIGLSLFSLEDKIKVNLIPKDILERGKDEFKLFLLSISNALLLLLLIFLSLFLINSVFLTKDSIKSTESNINSVNKSLEKYKGVEDEYKNLLKRKNEIDEFLKNYNKKTLNSYLYEIFKSKPDDLTIIDLQESNESFMIRVSGKSINSIYIMRKNLLLKEIFKDVKIKSIDRGADGIVYGAVEIIGGKK